MVLEWLAGVPAFFLLLIGALALIGKGALGGFAKSIVSVIPFGNVKLWAIIFVAGGLMLGGIAGGVSIWNSAVTSVSGVSTASLVSSQSSQSLVDVDYCELSTISNGGLDNGVYASGNFSFRADPTRNDQYYVDMKSGSSISGTATINGTLSCVRKNTADLSKGGSVDCEIRSSSFRSETSTTDSNTYYWITTGTTASKISGYTWAQNGYLNDGSTATTSSAREKTQLVFAQDTARRTLGFNIAVATATDTSLNNQTAGSFDVICGGKTAFKFVITKVK